MHTRLSGPSICRARPRWFLPDRSLGGRNILKEALYGLFFGPETSTANRAMIGGMVGAELTLWRICRSGNHSFFQAQLLSFFKASLGLAHRPYRA